jgi:XamI restriction endonuclease
MPINLDKPQLWKQDIASSVDMYNSWFIEFAPKAFRETRVITAKRVEFALSSTTNLTNITPDLLRQHPAVLSMLRMSTCPPIARDRLIGLAGISKNLVKSMEDTEVPRIPPRMPPAKLEEELKKIGIIIEKMADPDIFVWLGRKEPASDLEITRAATIVADRLCGAVSDPIVRNAQERRQLAGIAAWLEAKGYTQLPVRSGVKFNQMPPGTYSFRMNVSVKMIDDTGEEKPINIPVDAVIMPLSAKPEDFPLLLEAKSAGDFTNVNKRRKEEAQKMTQLRNTYGESIRFGLFLCGYFDSGYLGYEAAEGIDWVWEHRIDDLAQYGL